MRAVGVSEAPDIYTAAIGLYTVWLVVRAGSTLLHYMSQGLSILAWQISVWSLQVSACNTCTVCSGTSVLFAHTHIAVYCVLCMVIF